MLNWTDQQYDKYQETARIWASDGRKGMAFGLLEALYYADPGKWNQLVADPETDCGRDASKLNNFRKALLS